MKYTKSFPLILAALLLARTSTRAQVIVHDPANATIAIENHIEEVLKLVAMIKELEATKEWLGNPRTIVNLAGLNAVLANLQTAGVGQLRVDLARAATSAVGATYDGDGMYTAVGETFVSRSGQTITRPDVFKAEAALFNAVRDYDAVYEDVKLRRSALRAALGQTAAQLQAATTHAETLKASGVVLAQNAELLATDRELDFARNNVELIALQNRADKDRQEKARAQEQAREFSEALRLFTDALTPPVFGSQARRSSSAYTSQD